MSQSQKFKMWPQMRYDLGDYDLMQDFLEDDFQLQNIYLLAGGATSWVIRGFIPSWSGGNVITIQLTNSALFATAESTNLKGTMYVYDGPASTIDVPLTANATNYVHLQLSRATASPAIRTFWNPAANNGLGGEFQQTVDTAEIKQVAAIVTLTSPSADPSHILICKAHVNAGGVVTSLIDERNLYFRLGKNEFFAGIGSVGSVTYVPIGAPGVDDFTAGGAFTGVSSTNYAVEIDANGTPDTYQWSNDGGATWVATGQPIVANTPVLLEEAVYIEFSTEITSAVFAGVGLDDMTNGGSYIGTIVNNYIIEIDGVGATDTFRWSDNGGGSWTAGVLMTGLAQSLSDGVTVTFAAVTGHNLGDQWAFVASPGDVGHTIGDRWTFQGVANAGSSYKFVLGSPEEPNADLFVDINAFTGGDKEIDSLKELLDFMMSQILAIKFGTSTTNNYWYEDAPSNLSSFGVNLSAGGVFTWTLGTNTLSFTQDMVILLPGTAFSNRIRVVDHGGPPDGLIVIPTDNMVGWVDLDKTSNANLIVTVTPSVSYVAGPNRVIIVRRISNSVYVGI